MQHNSIRTVGLLTAVCGAIVLGGWVFAGAVGLCLGLAAAIGVTASSYLLGDSVALRAVRARPISEIQYPDLYRIVRELATTARQPVPRLYLSPLRHPNAFAAGRSPRCAVVCVTVGLLRTLDERELRGVLAHELSHVYNRDSLLLSATATVATIITWLANLAWLLPLGDSEDEDASGLLAALLFLVVGPLAAMVVRMGVSRNREYRADAAAAQLTGDPLGLAQALRKITVGVRAHPAEPRRALLPASHLMIVHPFPGGGMSRLFATHPPVADRIRRLRRIAG